MTTLAWEERCELALRFAPQLVLFPEDPACGRPGRETGDIGDYHPRGVGPLLERATITSGLFQPHRPATCEALAASSNVHDELRLLGKTLPDPDLAWRLYFDILGSVQGGRRGTDRFPPTIYARVQTRAEANAAARIPANIGKDYPVLDAEVGRPFFARDSRLDEEDLSIQYWFCYYYDDWANQHEGDWEGICLFLHRTARGYEPAGAGYFAHETGTRRHWTEIERSVTGGTHPLAFVAAGSHATYFQYTDAGSMVTVPGFIFPVLKIKLRFSASTTRVDRVPDRSHIQPSLSCVEVLPDPVGPSDPDASAWEHKKWLSFPGAWGIRPLDGISYGGPAGPSHKGLKWHNPFAWVERYCSPDFLVY